MLPYPLLQTLMYLLAVMSDQNLNRLPYPKGCPICKQDKQIAALKKKKHRLSWPLSYSSNTPPATSHQSTTIHQHILFVPHQWSTFSLSNSVLSDWKFVISPSILLQLSSSFDCFLSEVALPRPSLGWLGWSVSGYLTNYVFSGGKIVISPTILLCLRSSLDWFLSELAWSHPLVGWLGCHGVKGVHIGGTTLFCLLSGKFIFFRQQNRPISINNLPLFSVFYQNFFCHIIQRDTWVVGRAQRVQMWCAIHFCMLSDQSVFCFICAFLLTGFEYQPDVNMCVWIVFY